MHVRELAELAGRIAQHSEALLHAPGAPSSSALDLYWTASKERWDAWAQLLPSSKEPWPTTSPWMLRMAAEEVFVSELLSRVWAAYCVTRDTARGERLLGPLAHAVYLAHMESRNRVLRLLVHGDRLDPRDAAELDQLRRRCERWTDALLGRFPVSVLVTGYAFDIRRCEEFAREFSETSSQLADKLLTGSLTAAFSQGIAASSPHAAMHARVAAGVRGCLPAAFDGLRQAGSGWWRRMECLTEDAQAMVDELLSLHGAPQPSLTR